MPDVVETKSTVERVWLVRGFDPGALVSEERLLEEEAPHVEPDRPVKSLVLLFNEITFLAIVLSELAWLSLNPLILSYTVTFSMVK